MDDRSIRVETPALQGVLLLALQIQNRLAELADDRGAAELQFSLQQRIQVGVLKPNVGPSYPAVLVQFNLVARHKAEEDEKNYLEAEASFQAFFETDARISHEDLVDYTSSAQARNVALQAIMVCQRYFKDQIRLCGIPPEKIVFGQLGAFDKHAPETASTTNIHNKARRRTKQQPRKRSAAAT